MARGRGDAHWYPWCRVCGCWAGQSHVDGSKHLKWAAYAQPGALPALPKSAPSGEEPADPGQAKAQKPEARAK
eukprot:8747353-Lingulodinium_polyedra.AAC.1